MKWITAWSSKSAPPFPCSKDRFLQPSIGCTTIIGVAKGSRIFLIYQLSGCYIYFDDLKLCSNKNENFSSPKTVDLSSPCVVQTLYVGAIVLVLTTPGTGDDTLQDNDGAERHLSALSF